MIRVLTLMPRWVLLLVGAVLLGAGLVASFILYPHAGTAGGAVVKIAYIGPLTGANSKSGETMRRAVALAIDRFNATADQEKSRIALVALDDRNNPARAAELAGEAAADPDVLGVVGHNYSAASLAAGEVYREQGLVAITATSTANALTLDNPWYFRTIFNNAYQSAFLADYLKTALPARPVVIIRSDGAYGRDLGADFRAQAARIGIKIADEMVVDGAPDTPQRIANQVALAHDKAMIFLALQRAEAVPIIKALRDRQLPNLLAGPDSLSDPRLREAFSAFSRTRDNPGFYTDNLLVATPFLKETANQLAQNFVEEYQLRHGEEPIWSGPYAFDAARLLIGAIVGTEGFNTDIPIKDRRTRIRDHLSRVDSPARGVEGTTGISYFDVSGNSQKPITMGWFRGALVSTMTQLRGIQPAEVRGKLDRLRDKGVVANLGDQLMLKTAIAYTGIIVDEIKSLDFATHSAEISFRLWFRYQSKLDVPDVEFTNAAKPITLGKPVKSVTRDGISYRLYRVSGKFKLDFAGRRAPFGSHMVGIALRHRELEHDQLIYVPDVVTLPAIDGPALLKQLNDDQVISQGLGWHIQRAWIYQDIERRPTRGDPDHMSTARATYSQSRISFAARLDRDEISIRRQFLFKNQGIMVAVLLASLIAVIFSINHPRIRPYRNMFFIFEFAIAVILMLAAEGFILREMVSGLDSDQKALKFVVKFFDLLWWLVPMVFINIAIHRFVWTPLEKATNHLIPAVAKNFVTALIIILTAFGIIAFVFDEKITSLLATSGLIVMIIGLALQVNIANIFSGIALNIERPFQIGDWVEIGDTPIGKVIDISWRSTKIKTRTGRYLSVPNGQAAESIIRNYTSPNQEQEIHRFIQVNRGHEPARVCKILKDAIMSAPTAPGTKIVRGDGEFVGVGDWAARYEIIITIDDMDEMDLQMSLVMQSIWTNLNRFGIEQVTQRQDVFFHRHAALLDENIDPIAPLSVLNAVPIFDAFSHEEKGRLAGVIVPRFFDEGEDMIKQGDPGESMFLIYDGTVSILVDTPNGQIEVTRMGPGAFMGEMAMLTGEPRSASARALTRASAYEVSKHHLAPVIESNPSVLSELGEVIASRKLATQKKTMESQSFEAERKGLAAKLANAKPKFFREGNENKRGGENNPPKATAQGGERGDC